MARLGSVVLTLAAGFALACGDGEPMRPNVLLISIDALRGDRLGCYGYSIDTSPFVDELAESGTRFSHAFVNTHGTTASHATILSGLFQESHRAGYVGREPVAEEVPMVQEVFRRHGYTTLAVTDGGNVGSAFGFARGFDVYDDRGRGVRRGTEKLLAAIRQAPGDRPIFAFYHTYEVHSPYTPPVDFVRRFDSEESQFEPTSENLLRFANAAHKLAPVDLRHVSASYDAGIAYTDERLRWLFAQLRATGFLDRALVLLTADHGEELGEHGGLLHRDLLYDELLRVPLLVAGIGVPEARVEQRLVSSVDIVPTLLAAAGLSVPHSLPGLDLLSLPLPSRPVFSQYGSRRYSVRTAEWKLIETTAPPGVELFDLTNDPDERRNLAPELPGEVARMQRQLQAWLRQRDDVVGERREQEPELDAEQRRQLEALGYVE